jgi:alpha-L-fucosidase
MNKMPNYLKPYEELYRTNPREANMQWFRDAKYGLFLHYGLYSLTGKKEWVQLLDVIPVAEYAKLKDKFTAENFDADAIAAFAVDCGMKYINITTRHHDSFCLWETKETDFHSVNSPAGRDLVAELAAACEKYNLGLFLYYSHGRDWKHPHAPNNDVWKGQARPKYDPPEPSYKYGAEHNLDIYLQFMKNQITELLTKYPTAAGIWLDGISVTMTAGLTERFKTQELYDYIHNIHPHALVSYKQGLLGTEDFFTPEHKIPDKPNDNAEDYQKQSNAMGKIKERPEKPLEINTTMIQNPVSWSYRPDATHQTADEVWEKLRQAGSIGANLLLNTGPRADGSIDPIDDRTLREVGARLSKEGFPV